MVSVGGMRSEFLSPFEAKRSARDVDEARGDTAAAAACCLRIRAGGLMASAAPALEGVACGRFWRKEGVRAKVRGGSQGKRIHSAQAMPEGSIA